MSARETARSAFLQAQQQLALLEQGSFEEFDAEFAKLERTCIDLLRIPIAEFDDEAAALASQLVPLQRAICERLDALMAEAGEAASANRRGRTVLDAYRPDAAQLHAPRAV